MRLKHQSLWFIQDNRLIFDTILFCYFRVRDCVGVLMHIRSVHVLNYMLVEIAISGYGVLWKQSTCIWMDAPTHVIDE